MHVKHILTPSSSSFLMHRSSHHCNPVHEMQHVITQTHIRLPSFSPSFSAIAAEAAEYPARRLAAGATFRTQPTPADMQRGRADNMNRNSMPAAVERSGDSPRDVHRQSLPARLIMPRSRSRDSNGSSTTAEEQAAGVSHSILFSVLQQ